MLWNQEITHGELLTSCYKKFDKNLGFIEYCTILTVGSVTHHKNIWTGPISQKIIFTDHGELGTTVQL